MTATRKHRTLSCEALEARSLMAAGITSSLDANGVYRVVGTEGADTITIRQRDGLIWHDGAQWAQWANQVKLIVVNGGGGNDTILLNSEATSGYQPLNVNAWIFAGTGDDTVVGGAKYNVVEGDLGNDRIWGNGSYDLLSGGAGNDALYGQGGNDILLGGAGWDVLDGGVGNDLMDGGLDFDCLYGMAGDDVLFDDWAYRDGGVGMNQSIYRRLTDTEIGTLVRTFAQNTAGALNQTAPAPTSTYNEMNFPLPSRSGTYVDANGTVRFLDGSRVTDDNGWSMFTAVTMTMSRTENIAEGLDLSNFIPGAPKGAIA